MWLGFGERDFSRYLIRKLLFPGCPLQTQQTLHRLWLAEEMQTGLAPYPPQGSRPGHPYQLARRTISSPFVVSNPDSSHVSRDFTISPC